MPRGLREPLNLENPHGPRHGSPRFSGRLRGPSGGHRPRSRPPGIVEPRGLTRPAVVGRRGSPVVLGDPQGPPRRKPRRGAPARPVAHHRRGRPAASGTGSTCRCPQLCGTPWTAEAQFRRDRGSSSSGGPVDTSRSCPQECAQVGEIRPDAGPRTPPRPTSGTTADVTSQPTRRSPALFTPPPHHVARDPAYRPALVHMAWGRTGGNQGSGGGRTAVAVHGGRVVHVSTTDGR